MNIEAKNLSKIYGDGENRVVALDRANLEIVSSDFISIMGPSGSGKSTLLHLLSGLDKPSSGSLTYDGKDIYSYSDKELSAFRRKRIGFIFQQFNLLPVLTAKENIIMPLLLDKQKPNEAYLKQLTELLGIQGRLEHLPHGVRFIAINDNVDTENDAADDLTVSVKNIMNEAYCRDISVKTRSALEVKRRSGDFVGAFTIYGYVKVGDKHKSLEVDEYAANVVRDIFRKRLEGFSASHIADELNRLGILSPLAYKRNHGMPHAKGGYTDRKDCKWSATTIIRILQDETYTGTLVQGKQTTPHFKLKEREDKPSSEWIRVEGTHEAIIQKHDFDLVQRLRRIDTRTSPKSDKVYLFSGILICGCCGCRMTRKTNRYKDKEYHYYYCPTGKKNGCTSSVMLKESDLIECVQDSLKGHIENVASLDALLSSISQERINRELAQEYAAQIRVNEKRVAQTEGFKAKLYENLVSGILTKEEFLSYKRKYNADIELFQKAIVEWNDKLTDVLENRSERNRWINHFMKFSTMEDIDRRAVMQLIRSIRVMGKDELHIEFNYQDEYQKAISLAEQIATKNEERMVG